MYYPSLSTYGNDCRTMSISSKLVRRPNETPHGAGSNQEADDAGYGIGKATEASEKGVPPRPRLRPFLEAVEEILRGQKEDEPWIRTGSPN